MEGKKRERKKSREGQKEEKKLRKEGREQRMGTPNI